MRFWWRELAGWTLVLLGLVAFYLCIAYLFSNHAIFEAPTAAFIGFILFRGGIQLLKVAMAARVCSQDQEAPPAPRPGTNRPVVRRPSR